MKFTKIYDCFLWLTNNEKKPVSEWRKDEVIFDIAFFITIALSIILGLGCFIGGVVYKFKGLFEHNNVLSEVGSILIEGGWIFLGVLFFIETWDSIRHNRE